MAIITHVEVQRRKVTVTLDDEEQLVLPLSLFRQRPLSEGEIVDLTEYNQWALLQQYREALDKAVAMLAARPHSSGEIRQKLARAMYLPETVDMVIYKLEKEHLLDDEDFARSWAASRNRSGMGSRRIAQELRRKGIDAEMTEAALSDISEEDAVSQAAALARKAVQKAASGEDPRKTAKRVLGMLSRRGFPYDVAKEALEQAIAEVETEAPDW